ncbi:Kunitz/Bovine pancreatic trypsin inhibitor domain protein [Oesophagostomum dentatum]|uniref:Kunitz/Bovine pancreatic trypsin inhibitor domain protein n=1 Tax=Oesophagostomum dentatum TaxID=61180 RepID=A0A0B1SPW5_OESDE|nr:Kunitz/Bovine pancreatic trypsin inhibitor domain protein [Oesophagostomum dentatum]
MSQRGEKIIVTKLSQSNCTHFAVECLEPFDLRLAESCNNGTEWKNRFFYDSDLRVCRMYWHGGCFSSHKNDFEDQETCQWKCMGTHSNPASRACLDHFDQAYKEDCRHGEYSDRYFFNHERKRCEHFHWGGCQSSSENFFLSMGGCRDLCEEPARELSRKFSKAMNTRIFMQFKYILTNNVTV